MAFLVCYLVSLPLVLVYVGFLTLPVVWIWSMVDAFSAARSWNRRHGLVS